jgi:hypothetical protein
MLSFSQCSSEVKTSTHKNNNPNIEVISNTQINFLDSTYRNDLTCDTILTIEGFKVRLKSERENAAGIFYPDIYFNRIYIFKSRVYYNDIDYSINDCKAIIMDGGNCLNKYSFSYPFIKEEFNELINGFIPHIDDECSETITIYIQKQPSSYEPVPISVLND